VKKGSPQSEELPQKGKITFFKKALRRAPYNLLLNLENSQVSSFSISTSVFGEDLSRKPAGEIY